MLERVGFPVLYSLIFRHSFGVKLQGALRAHMYRTHKTRSPVAGGPQPAVLAAVTAVITSIALLTYAKAVQFKDGMKTRGSRLPLDEAPLDPEPDLPSLEISTPAAQMSATQGKGLTLRALLTRKTDSLRAASMELGVLGAAGSLVHTVGLTQV